MNYSDLLFTEHSKAFLVLATIYVVIWTIEMRLGLTFKARLTQNPQTLEENLNNVVKFGVNRSKDNAFLFIYFISMLMAFYHAYGVSMWLERHFPLLTKDGVTYWMIGITSFVHLGLLILKPPSLIKKFRTRYCVWMASSYVSFFILGWLPVTTLGIYKF
jgi:hypothetical protein